MSHTARIFCIAIAAPIATACGGGGTGPVPPPPPPPSAVTMAKAVSSGDAQSAALGTVLPNLLRVLVTQGGAPLAGRTVSWTITPDGGSAAPAASVSGADGIASSSITLPPIGAPAIISATSAGVTGSPVIFNAEATGAGMTATVRVENTFFSPDAFRLRQGGTVTFTWGAGSGPHTVTPVAPNSIPASPNQPVTRSAPFTFDAIFAAQGTFKFFCVVHGAPDTGMHGTITVVP